MWEKPTDSRAYGADENSILDPDMAAYRAYGSLRHWVHNRLKNTFGIPEVMALRVILTCELR